jgi:outer membrane immunogenic protein
LHAGWAFDSQKGTTTSVTTDLLGLPTSHSLNHNGPIYGAQAGYNMQFSNWVVGIEGDFSGAHVKATSSQSVFPNVVPLLPRGTATMTSELEWLASIRGRLGVTWASGWGPSLIYVTGGVAFAGITYGGTYDVVTPFTASATISKKNTQTGWVVGGGLETMLTGNWTIRGEYLYYRFDGANVSTNLPNNLGVPPLAATLAYRWNDLTVQAARLAFNYKF